MNYLGRKYTSQVRVYPFWYIAVCEKHFVSSLATVSALAFVIGAANKYFEKTSIPVRTNLYTGDFNGLNISICIMSPGYDCNDESG